MLTAGWVCNREVHFGEPEESARAVAARMRDRSVGAILVLDADRQCVGIVTDRDLVLRVLAAGRDPDRTPLAQVMSRRPHVVHEDAPLEEVLALMRDACLRRVPVVDRDGRLQGIVTLDDVQQLLADQLAVAGQVLASQSPVRAAAGAVR